MENKETVTINLGTYDTMREELKNSKSTIDELKREINCLYRFINKIGIPADVLKDVNTEDIKLTVCYSDDIETLNRKFQINFEVGLDCVRR